MQNIKTNAMLAFLLASVLSCTNQPHVLKMDQEKMEAIVKKQNDLLANYFKTANAEGLASLYTDSAKLSPDRNDFVFGRENIKAFWKKDFENSKLLEMNTRLLTTNGTEAIIYETGKTTTKSLYKDSIYNFTVKYINVWVKQPDGSYKLDIDFWNEDK